MSVKKLLISQGSKILQHMHKRIISADDMYDKALDTIQRKAEGDPSVTDVEYQIARDLMSPVFISIRFDREDKEFPDHIKD